MGEYAKYNGKEIKIEKEKFRLYSLWIDCIVFNRLFRYPAAAECGVN